MWFGIVGKQYQILDKIFSANEDNKNVNESSNTKILTKKNMMRQI